MIEHSGDLNKCVDVCLEHHRPYLQDRKSGSCLADRQAFRLQHAKELLETADLRVNEVALKTGFETASNFTKIFTKQFGMKPSMIGKNPDEMAGT